MIDRNKSKITNFFVKIIILVKISLLKYLEGERIMCTAATYRTKDFYFGRTLDYDFSYGDEVVITPGIFLFILLKRER